MALISCEGLRTGVIGHTLFEHFKQLTTDQLQLFHLIPLGEVGACRQPIPHGCQPPAFPRKGHATHDHAKEGGARRVRFPRLRLEP